MTNNENNLSHGQAPLLLSLNLLIGQVIQFYFLSLMSLVRLIGLCHIRGVGTGFQPTLRLGDGLEFYNVKPGTKDENCYQR